MGRASIPKQKGLAEDKNGSVRVTRQELVDIVGDSRSEEFLHELVGVKLT